MAKHEENVLFFAGIAQTAHIWANGYGGGTPVDWFLAHRWADKAKYDKDGNLVGKYTAWGKDGVCYLRRTGRTVDKVTLGENSISW